MTAVMNSFVEEIYAIHYTDSVTGDSLTEFTDAIEKVKYYMIVHDNVEVMRGICYFEPFNVV